MNLSVCVPVHDPEGAYASYLEALVYSVALQDQPPDELVLASNHAIRNRATLKSIVGDRFELVFIRTAATNAPANLNAAIRNCRSDFVKILFQDDILSARETLSSSLEAIKSESAAWCAVMFDHLEDASQKRVRPMLPKFSENLIRGRNRIGAPSVIMFSRAHWLEFDERMVFTFDCDWYLMMSHRWGPPAIDANLGVTVRLHAGQATHWAREMFKSETSMMKKKHRESRGRWWGTRKSECSCLLQGH